MVSLSSSKALFASYVLLALSLLVYFYGGLSGASVFRECSSDLLVCSRTPVAGGLLYLSYAGFLGAYALFCIGIWKVLAKREASVMMRAGLCVIVGLILCFILVGLHGFSASL